MLKEFERTESHKGVISIDSKLIGECRYDLTYNPYALNDMRIMIRDAPVGLHDIICDYKSISIISEFYREKYLIEVMGILSGQWSDKQTVLTGRVKSFIRIEGRRKVQDVKAIFIHYKFPLVSMTDDKWKMVRHYRFGFFREKYDLENKKYELEDDELVIQSEIGQIKISDCFDFEEIAPENTLYDITTCLNRSFVEVKIDAASNEYLQVIQIIRAKIEDLFLLISLIERDRINWHTEILTLLSEQDQDVIQEQTTFRWSSPASENYRRDYKKFNERRETLKKIFPVFEALTDDQKKVVRETIRNFTTASCSRTIETKFIHWHSCLDFFKKLLSKEKKGSFSYKLISVLDSARIYISDMICPNLLEKIRNSVDKKEKVDFRFTELRNGYIHDGFDVFSPDYLEAVEQIEIMRVIAERLLLNYMGIDYKQTCFRRRDVAI
jgi:hypothetical protein